MTKKEAATMARLEAENAALRAKLDHHFKIYAEQLHEIVDLKGRERVILDAINELYGMVSV